MKEKWAAGAEISDKDHAIAIVYGDIIDLDYDRDIAPIYETDEEN